MFNGDTVRKTVSAVAEDLNIDGNQDSINAKDTEELISRSIYRCLTSTDFQRSICQSIAVRVKRR